MTAIPKDGNYTFKVGEALPEWCGFAPGAKIERGFVKCHVYKGNADKWEISDNTLLEGDCYLYNDGKKISKIHIKEKRRIPKNDKHRERRIDKTAILWIFVGVVFLIFLASFIIHHS